MKHAAAFIASFVLASVAVACAAGDRMGGTAFVQAPTDPDAGANAYATTPPVQDIPPVAASAPEDLVPTAKQLERFKALVAATCPSPTGTGAPIALSPGGQALWGTPIRAMARLITTIQQLEGLLQATPSAAASRFQVAMAYYELEVAAYQDCLSAGATLPTRQYMLGLRTSSINARAKTMAGAVKMGKKHCAFVNASPGFVPPAPCPS